MPYTGAYIPTNYKTITKEDAKRLLAIEQRLDYAIERAGKLSFSYEEYNVLRDFLKYIKGEKDNAE